MRFAPLIVLLLGAAAARAAEPQLASIFRSGMVLQRDMPIPVWGVAADGTVVQVQLGDDVVKTKAVDGKWSVRLPARGASADPLTMKVTVAGPATATTTIDNIVVGEVWLCAGQSNMAQVINKRAPREVQDMPLVRQYAKPRGRDPKPATWLPAVGDHIKRFSVTALYFGESLHKELDVPIGLVLAAHSGSAIERWIPRERLASDPKTKAVLDKLSDREARAEMVALSQALRDGKTLQPADHDVMSMRLLSNAGSLYRAYIEPVEPYALRGAIWYQGEANARYRFNAAQYKRYLPMLAGTLRERFGQKDLPFYVVQLPSIKRKDIRYEWIRQAQLDAVRAMDHAGLAVTIDINEGLHPRSKHITGDRLGLLALSRTYGLGKPGQPDSGPLLANVVFADGSATCRFDHAEGGLELRPTEQSLFELAGPDGVYRPATAAIDGGTVVIRSETVARPMAVRYAYQPVIAQAALFGSTGLPASPFEHSKATTRSTKLPTAPKPVAKPGPTRSPVPIERTEKSSIEGPVRDETGGIDVYTVTSPYTGRACRVDVLLPHKLEQGKTYRTLYVLPVGGEWSPKQPWGNGLAAIRQANVHNRHGLISVSMEFDSVPWYGSHASNTKIRHDAYLMKVIVPMIEARYPTTGKAEDRLLIGFSKSGWGAVSLLLRNLEYFGAACSWDAPLMMSEKNLKWGSAKHFGTPEAAAPYVPATLVPAKADQLADRPPRLVILGHNLFGRDTKAFHALLEKHRVPHRYDDSLRVKHGWQTGWVAKAVEIMLSDKRGDARSERPASSPH